MQFPAQQDKVYAVILTFVSLKTFLNVPITSVPVESCKICGSTLQGVYTVILTFVSLEIFLSNSITFVNKAACVIVVPHTKCPL